MRVEAKVGAAPSPATHSVGALFCLSEGLDLRVCHFWDAREVQPLTSVLLAEGKRPHPKLAAQHLFHILKPEHVEFVRLLFKSTISGSGVVCADAWVLDLFILHHLNRGEVIVELDDDSECEWD